MSLKENIESVKKEIGAEEQFLESVIKSERFFKKYKKLIISTALIVVVGGATYAGLNMAEESRLEASNQAYSKLLINPSDSASIAILKDKNERLYYFYKLQIALESGDKKALEELASYKNDVIISDIASYQLGDKKSSNSELLKGFISLQEGFNLLKDEKINEAKLKFAGINLNSPLKNIANKLEHYQGKNFKGAN